jgi:hypothetical protein
MMVVVPALTWTGPLDVEAIAFVRNYWSDSSLLQRIFDPNGNDFGAYQARELSYAVDFVDAQWLAALLRSGRTVVVPLSGFVSSLLIVAIVLRGARTGLPGLPVGTTLLALLLFLSNFAVQSTQATFYRSSKAWAATLLLAVLLLVWRELHAPRVRPAVASAVLFVLGVALCLFDRQGYFDCVVLAAALALVFARTRRGGFLLLGASAAAVVATVYSFWLGPYLIHELNGYWPSFHYQRLPWHKFANPRFYREAVELLFAYASTLFGGLPSRLIALLALLAAALWLRRARLERAPGNRYGGLAPLLVLFVAASQVGMFAAMIMRHRSVYEVSDARVFYYPLVFQALLLFGLLVLLERLARAGAGARRWSAIVLALLTLANLVRWPELREVMAEGPWVGWTTSQTAFLRASLREGRPHPGLFGHYRDFYWECRDRFPALPAAPEPEVRESAGFWQTDLRDGRVFAWARATAKLRLRVEEPGEHRLAAMVLLRPHETVTLTQGGLRRLSVSRHGDRPGLEPLAVTLRLPRGLSEVELSSDLPEQEIMASPGTAISAPSEGRAAFGVAFPILLFRETPDRSLTNVGG